MLGGPPGRGGGFGSVGEANEFYETLANAIKRMTEIRDNVEGDSMNTERYVKELSQVMIKVTKAAGIVFEQEQLRFFSMYLAAGSGVPG
jgi:hypothetical protein